MMWGMPTLAELPDAASNVELCARLGLSFLELNMNMPMFQAEMLTELRPLQDAFGIGFTIHADENLNPTDFNPIVAEAYRETMRRTIRAAKALGAPIVNMHLVEGVYFTLPDRKLWLYDRYRVKYLEAMRAFRALCEAEIGASDVCVCVENTGGYADFQREALELLLQSDAFALTWDIGHSHTAKTDDAPFLNAHADRLRHFHIHDADTKRCHLPLGEGKIELLDRIALAERYGCRCVLEVKDAEALTRSVEWLRAHNKL